jgi:hypothetical protein
MEIVNLDPNSEPDFAFQKGKTIDIQPFNIAKKNNLSL